MTKPTKSKTKPEQNLYQLRIKLLHSKPPIWRRVVVPANLTLETLHEIIQCVMPWTNSHLHQFVAGDVYYGSSEYGDGEKLDEAEHTLAEIAPVAKARFVYEYDFGDGWEHEVVVQKILPPVPDFKHPTCLAGKNACPPDDCGGIYGYYDMLRILADPKHEQYEEISDWLGAKWDATAFDVEMVNDALSDFKF